MPFGSVILTLLNVSIKRGAADCPVTPMPEPLALAPGVDVALDPELLLEVAAGVAVIELELDPEPLVEVAMDVAMGVELELLLEVAMDVAIGVELEVDPVLLMPVLRDDPPVTGTPIAPQNALWLESQPTVERLFRLDRSNFGAREIIKVLVSR